MSTIKVKAIDSFDGHHPGAVVELPERQANELIGMGLAKMHGPASNKMKVEPANKTNPSPAVGEAKPSSASPAARASRQPTARKSASGKNPAPDAE